MSDWEAKNIYGLRKGDDCLDQLDNRHTIAHMGVFAAKFTDGHTACIDNLRPVGESDDPMVRRRSGPWGGYRDGAGRKKTWATPGATTTIRVPKALAERVMVYARSIDSDGISALHDSETKTTVIETESSNAIPRTTAEAYYYATLRGFQGTKDAFRSWSRRNPDSCFEKYSLKVADRKPGDRSNRTPSYYDTAHIPF